MKPHPALCVWWCGVYVDPGWVLICMPKTGTTTARHVCHRLGRGTANFGRVHLTAANWRDYLMQSGSRNNWLHAVARRPGIKVYGTIREPVAWYRSVWAYARSPRYNTKGAGRRWLERWADGASEDFGIALRAWRSRGGMGEWRAEEMINPDPTSQAPTLYQAAVGHYYGAGVGGWIRLEHQAEDLARVLGVDAGRIRRMGIRNVTPGVDRGECADLADLVQADRVFWANLLTR